MGDNEFYLKWWRMVLVLLTILVVAISSCSISTTVKINDTVSRMVTEGNDPKEAGCAVALANNNLESTRIYCMAIHKGLL